MLPSISNCDHCVVAANLLFRRKKDPVFKRHIWDYGNADFEEFKTYLREVDWTSCFVSNDIDECCNAWSKLFMEAAVHCIPNKHVEIRPSDLPWYNSRLRSLKRRVKRKYDKAKSRNFEPGLWNSFCESRNYYQEQLKLAEEEHNNKLRSDLNNSSRSSKCWWRTVKHFMNKNHSTTVPSLIHDGKHIPDSLSKAEIFNSFFLEQSKVDSSSASLPEITDSPVSSLDSITISETEVLDVLLSLDTSKASGPDGISAKLLKEAAPAISPSLTKLFNTSLANKKFPLAWKQANVSPLHKKGPDNLCNNYRPVSLLSCTGKVFEKIVFKNVFNFFRDNTVISAHQSGFIPGDSTINQLLLLYHELCLAVDQQKEVRIIFLDISKAFDKVWHPGLLHKLRKAGIMGDLLAWFSDYLRNRCQRVVINGQSSSWGKICAGVPQGSVLGPLMFLIYINDIVNVVRSNIKMFADDTSLYLTVDNPITAAQTLNMDLSDIDQWSKDWLVTFNALKTDSMLISRRAQTPTHPPILFQGHVLQDVAQHKHLGVTLRSDLRWSDHIADISTKSTKLINIMKSLKFTLDRKTLDTIYTSFIRPILEYGSLVWSGCTAQDEDKLESIQLNAARIVTGAMHGTSNAKLYEETGWLTLAKRREISNLTFMYKLVHKLAPDPVCSILSTASFAGTHTYATRQQFDLPHFRARTDLFDKSFYPSTIRLWNQLPLEIRNSDSIRKFKSSIAQPVIRAIKFDELYNFGNRFLAIQHTRLRLDASQLNSHLFKIGIKNTPKCSCGAPYEDSYHYFFHCPNYTVPRSNLHTVILQYAPFTLQTILYGSSNCSLTENIEIFSAVHNYISETERFKSGVG